MMSRFLDVEIGNKKLPPIGAYWQHSLVPLNEALQPVKSQFDQLDRSIDEAKKHCCYPSKHNLTREESAAVYLYTMEGGDNSFYRVLNEALRSENRRALKPWFGFLKLFDTALAKLPTVQKCVWRGVSANISEQYKKGETLTWWSVNSCSLSLEIVQDFIGSDDKATLLMIETKTAKDVSDYTSFPEEKEVILPPGTQLYVESNALHHHGGLYVVHLVEVQNGHEAQLSTAMTSMDLSSQSKNKKVSDKSQPISEFNPVSATKAVKNMPAPASSHMVASKKVEKSSKQMPIHPSSHHNNDFGPSFDGTNSRGGSLNRCTLSGGGGSHGHQNASGGGGHAHHNVSRGASNDYYDNDDGYDRVNTYSNQ